MKTTTANEDRHRGVSLLSIFSRSVALPVLLTAQLLTSAIDASAAIFATEEFEVYADMRLRGEHDWDSQDATGVPRHDRPRLRVRARLGFDYHRDDHLSFAMRLRTGAQENHQSANVSILGFGADDDTGDADFNFDRWLVRYQREGLWTWAGRDEKPFWQPNDMFWDADAVNLGYHSLPVGMRNFSGNLASGQVVWRGTFGGVDLTVAGGVFRFDADPDDADGQRLLNGNGARDYTIAVLNGQARVPLGGRPLSVGADFMHNAENYDPDDEDPFTAAHADQIDGYVLSGLYGGLEERADWLVGYYFARIETLAVHSSYAEDDWVRWGTAEETRASDLKGHELRAGYAFSPTINLLARLFLVEAITSVEDGKRFRVDLNIEF